MRSLPFPKRIQLVKLLRAHGLRDVERLREDELREAVARLQILITDGEAIGMSSSSLPASSSVVRAHGAEPPPVFDDSDDPHALPRFREPKLFLPEQRATFLRAIPVKPRTLFCTWDVEAHVRHGLHGPVRIDVRALDFLGEAPEADAVLRLPVAASVDVELGSPGWYIPVPPERQALVCSLMSGERVLAHSNVALLPPARPAPPGALWMATLGPGVDRRQLLKSGLLRGKLPSGVVVEKRGETDARGIDSVEDLPGSSFRFKGNVPVPSPPSSSAAAAWSGQAYSWRC